MATEMTTRPLICLTAGSALLPAATSSGRASSTLRHHHLHLASHVSSLGSAAIEWYLTISGPWPRAGRNLAAIWSPAQDPPTAGNG